MVMKCNSCGFELKRRYYSTYGVLLLLSCPPAFLLLMFISYGTPIPYLHVLFNVILAIYFILKKEKYFYFCKKCQKKYNANCLLE